MALVTIQRSPSPSTDPDLEAVDSSEDVSDGRSQIKKSLSESYFTVKGAALILPHNECTKKSSKKSHGGEIQSHLQAMLRLLRPEDTIKIAVRLEDIYSQSHPYMALVSTHGRQDHEESVILGIDCTGTVASIGLVLPVWMGLVIKLGGDGGFSLCTDEHSYLFKPVSVQAMWSAIQSLWKASLVAEDKKYIPEGLTHTWIGYYKSQIDRRDAARGPWNVEGVEVFAPSSLTVTSEDENERIKMAISQKLKEVMMTVDLDEATSRMLRTEVEAKLGMSLANFKGYFDEEVMRILGQMDEPSKILDFLYLGSEWNASNLEELKEKGIGYILNVTKEIDNFFVGMFHYYNVRVYDVEESELLKHWDKTYKFISKARDHNSKVLVHCKMGVSRSASTVMAFLMKDRRWTAEEAYEFVKEKRSCVHPNSGFMEQLNMYQAILTASNQRDIFRHKSEQNLLEESSKEDTEVAQGSFLGDSLFRMMSHSNWPATSEGVTREEEWIRSLNTDQVLGADMLQMDTDLETADSRSADSMEEALPDVPSPPPLQDSAEATSSSYTARPIFIMPSSDVEMTQETEPSSESESCSAWCSSDGQEKTGSLSIPAVSALTSRIRPDSSWIKLNSLDDSQEKDESCTDNLPYIDALPSDDLYSNTQPDSSATHDATAAPEGITAAVGMDESSLSTATTSATTATSTTTASGQAIPGPQATSEPASLPYSSSYTFQVGIINSDKLTGRQSGEVEFYIGKSPSPTECKPVVPLIVVNSEVPQESLSSVSPANRQFSSDHISYAGYQTGTRDSSLPSANLLDNMAGVDMGQHSAQGEQILNEVMTETGKAAATPGNEVAVPEKQDQSAKAEGGDAPVSTSPTARGQLGKIEPGIRQYFFREKIPWKPGKVKKIQEGINKTGQISTDEDDDEGNVRERLRELPLGKDLRDDRTLLDQMCDQQRATTLSQSHSCMELFSPGEREGSPKSLYEREEIPMEPGTVLRTRLEIEERQRLFCGEGDQEIFGSSRPVIRTSSLKQERDTPRSRYADNRRLTCGPIMSPLSGKSLDDLRSVGASAANLSDIGPLSPQSPAEMKYEDSGPAEDEASHSEEQTHQETEKVTIKVKDEETPIEAGIVRKQKMELQNRCDSDRSSSRPATASDSLTSPVLSTVPAAVSPPPPPPPSPAVSEQGSQQHDPQTSSSPWKHERTRGNFDSETLALIREIGSALLMSPTPPKPEDPDDEEPCTNMVKYFVRKIEKQTETRKKSRDIILIDSDSKKTVSPSREDGSRGKSSGIGTEASIGGSSSAFQLVTTPSEATKPADIYESQAQSQGKQLQDLSVESRHRQLGMRQESSLISSPTKASVTSAEAGSSDLCGTGMSVDFTYMQTQAVSPSLERQHNITPTSLPLSKEAEPAGGGVGGMNSSSSPRSHSHPGTCESPEPSVVRHLVGRFESRSPEAERVSSEPGHDFTYRSRDNRDTSPSTSPVSYPKALHKEDLWPGLYSSVETTHAGSGSSSQSLFTPISSSSLQPSSTVVTSSDPVTYPWTSSPLSSPSPSSSSPLSLHRKHASLDSAQTQPTLPKKSPLAFDIAVELYELPSPSLQTCCSAPKVEPSSPLRKPGPTPFSKSSMESTEPKTWRSVRPKSADHAQRSTSSSDYDSESSVSDLQRSRKAGNTFDRPMAYDDDVSLRQVSDEGRKIRRLQGKSHPLTKLAQQRKGPFYSSM